MSEDRTAPDHLRYNSEHTWLMIDPDGTGRAGVTHYAQKQLKDVVFVELPELESAVVFMEPFGVIESAKATNDLYSPVSGRVTGRNEKLGDDPGLVNRDPYGEGWMITISLSQPDEVKRLLSAGEYRALVGGGG
jgi:glycine cleavage system H protein